MDLCSISGVSSFDTTWGDWYFESTDMNEWPPGEYSFRITGTIADQSDSYDLFFILLNPCQAAEFTVTSLPF